MRRSESAGNVVGTKYVGIKRITAFLKCYTGINRHGTLTIRDAVSVKDGALKAH